MFFLCFAFGCSNLTEVPPGTGTKVSSVTISAKTRLDVYDYIKNYEGISDADKNLAINGVNSFAQTRRIELPPSLQADPQFQKELLAILIEFPDDLYHLIINFNDSKSCSADKKAVVISVSKILRSSKTPAEKEKDIKSIIASKSCLAGLDKKFIDKKWPLLPKPTDPLFIKIYDLIYGHNNASNNEKNVIFNSVTGPVSFALIKGLDKIHRDKAIDLNIAWNGNYQDLAFGIKKILDEYFR
jgi:hypothetical protein